jgi:hypothetical protein
MSIFYYAAVEDDPLTSGKGSCVFAFKPGITIQGEDGKRRRLAFIGDEAYCSKCNSTGVITYGAGLDSHRRLTDHVHGGRRQAVGGDIVLCRCSDHPRIIATYGRIWRITDGDAGTSMPICNPLSQSIIYDEQFTLTDASGNALADIWYTMRMPSGELRHGITDSNGQTGRFETKGSQSIRIYLGHRQEP